MSDVRGNHIALMMRRGRPDQQILEWNSHPAAPLLPGNPARQSRDSSRHRVNNHVGDQIVQKRPSLLAVRFQICPFDPVRQFH
jgi:hypothetical protein